MYNLPSHQPSNIPDSSALRHAPCSLLFALFGILLSLVSCDKSTEAEFSYPSPRIKTITEYSEQGMAQIFSFEYDSLGRIVKRSYMPATYEKYDYPSNSLIVMKTYKNETLEYIDSLFLNDQGLVITKKNKMADASLSGTFTFTTTYEYNSEGYLVKSSEGNTTCEIQDGNTVKKIYSSYTQPFPLPHSEPDSSLTKSNILTFTYEFSPNTSNTTGNENMGMSFYGKQDKNLVINADILFSGEPWGPLYGNSYAYAYSYDSQKRVTKCTTLMTYNYETYTYY